jgi:hypothetical protein
MTDRKPMYVTVDGLDRPTGLSEFTTNDFVPAANGGTGASSVQAATGLVYDSAAGTLTTADDVDEVTFLGGSEKLIARHVHVSNTLSGGPDCSTTLSTSASVSGCPFPPPFNYIAAGADLGTGVDNFYFGSGVSVQVTNSTNDGITFDSTNGYWNIADAGWYEVHGFVSQNVSTSPVTVTTTVITTTGYGGTESIKSAAYTVLRANIDPHDTVAHWIGYLAAGVKLAIKCDASTGTMFSERGSSASVKRIA